MLADSIRSVQKAESAAKKQEAANALVAAQEDAKWSEGSKNSAKTYYTVPVSFTSLSYSFLPLLAFLSTYPFRPSPRSVLCEPLHHAHKANMSPPLISREDAAAKKAEAARKKAERDALLAEEEASARSTPKASKTATKKSAPAPSRGTLDLSQLDAPASSQQPQTLNATGIDSALDLLSLTSSTAATDAGNIDRHPERRFKAAYKVFEERRLPEIERESPGLRRNQRIEMCRKEFEKSPENPFNQVSGRFDSTRDELRGLAEGERKKKEGILGRER